MNEEHQDWNINEAGSKILGGLIDQVNTALIAGDEKMALNTMTVLFNNICGHKKVKALEENLKAARILLRDCQELVYPKPKDVMVLPYYKEDIKELKRKLLDLQEMINNLMYDAGLWFSVFEKDTRKPIYKS